MGMAMSMGGKWRIASWASLLLVLTMALTAVAGTGTMREIGPVVPFYTTPQQMDLCGEPVPLKRADVWERFDREFTIVVYSHAQVYLWLKRMERYLPWIERQLRQYKLPEDLKYVAVAESDLLDYAYSPARAAGLWQFIPSTGQRYGLRRGNGIDERYDFEKATVSALRYLKDLHQRFHDWALALAAYNCGEQRVEKEIRRQGVGNYYALKLPLQTERYVFRILAIKAVLSRPQRYGYYLPKGAGYSPFNVDRVHVLFRSSIPIQEVGRSIHITYRDFKRLNPAFRGSEIPPGVHVLRVPQGMGPAAQQQLAELAARYKPKAKPKPKPRFIIHKVRKGETLSRIARRYHVRTTDIKRWNGLRRSKIYIGQKLKIYKK